MIAILSLITYYQFDGNLTDSEGNATLTELATNTTSGYGNNTTGSYWSWTSSDDRGGGFQIDIPEGLITDSYSIGIRFQYDEISSGWEKIIDYQNRISDNGFYFNKN